MQKSKRNPYINLPRRQYWASYSAYLKANNGLHKVLWEPKFSISQQDKIVTFGSCFAQHFNQALIQNGYNWLCTEDLPASVDNKLAKDLGYRIFSCRTGNIYTTSMLNQWIDWSLALEELPTEVWQYNDKFYDPIRPVVEAQGFESVDEMQVMRRFTCQRFAQCIREADVFVFTLGLTEAWINLNTNLEYPICPMAIGVGESQQQAQFVNYDYTQVKYYLEQAIEKLRSANPTVKILLTVSPVPLIATQSNNHVLVATTASKSILRAVCASVVGNHDYVDYFPSYEIISNPFKQQDYYASDRRKVCPDGVDFVMQHFFEAIQTKRAVTGVNQAENSAPMIQKKSERNFCEEELLTAFLENDKEER